MTSKQKVLDHLEPFRSKDLSLGCEVRVDDVNGEGYSIWVYIGTPDTHDNQTTLWHCKYSTFATVEWGNFKLEDKTHVIIGHPLTHADLLRALHKSGFSNYNKIWMQFKDEPDYLHYEKNNTHVHIPLNYRHLEDIEDDHPMWQQLCKVFNLV